MIDATTIHDTFRQTAARGLPTQAHILPDLPSDADATQDLFQKYFDSLCDGRIAAMRGALIAGDGDMVWKLAEDLLFLRRCQANRDEARLQALLTKTYAAVCRAAAESGYAVDPLVGFGDGMFAPAAMLQSLCLRLVENLGRRSPAPETVQYERVVSHMRTHLHEKLTLDTVAAAAGMPRSRLRRLLAARAQTTFNALLNDLRIERAKDLLLRSDKRLAAIASECGFRDHSYFTKVFRSVTGRTPIDYRKTA